jgi:hypothetical protein
VSAAEAPSATPRPSDESAVQQVELSLPVRPDLVFLARMTAAAVATRADFGFDQVEDLRLAIDELCITVTGEEGGDGRLHLRFDWSAEAIKVVATLSPAGADALSAVGDPASIDAPTPNELSERILDALVDEHGAEAVGGVPSAWIILRRREPS